MLRVDDNPPTRHPQRPIDAAEGPWWVAKIKPRMEKALASDFLLSNIEYYLPMITRVTRRKDNNKPRKSIIPLFPGYICFAMETPRNIFSTGRVVNLIEIKNQRHFIGELSALYQALEIGVPLEPCTNSFERGEMVEVTTGSMRGVRGVISQINGQSKLIIEVRALGCAMITIDPSMVKQVPAEKS